MMNGSTTASVMTSASAGGTPLDYRPLLPPISWLTILLPPLLIALSLLLHILHNEPEPDRNKIKAHVFRAKTSHARYLPKLASHVFTYPVLYLGVDLRALERRELDLDMKLFSWAPSRWTVTAIHPGGYLDPSVGAKGIRGRLMNHLEQHGVVRELVEEVYTVTMPAYLGMEGINPLTTHFCYASPRGKLNAVVLEVHNTFGERHLYVLRVGVEEDEEAGSRYQHQWTFPRAFHVSPFNDRSGFYRVSINDPLCTSSITSASASAPLPSPSTCARDTSTALPSTSNLDIKIITLTSSYEKKLFASLSGTGVPFTSSSLLSSLLKFPFSLLLTTPRILYQAGKLHFAKRLDVFPRPEPFIGHGGGKNEVEKGAKAGNVGWQPAGGMEVYAQGRVERFLEERLKTVEREGKPIKVVLQPADKTQPPIALPSSTSTSSGTHDTLTITYFTPVFFTDLLVSPSISLALEVGSHLEHRWITSNDNLFLSIFSPPSLSRAVPQPYFALIAKSIRHRLMAWSLSFSPHSHSEPPNDLPLHPLDDKADFMLVRRLWLHGIFLKIGYWVFVATGARFVKGTEGWSEWARWAEEKGRREGRGGKALREQDVKEPIEFGSVLRPKS